MNNADVNGLTRTVIVSFSGPDGSGKTTLANRVAARVGELGSPDLGVHRLWLRWNPKGKIGKRESDVESTLDVRHKGNLAKRIFTKAHAGSAWVAAAERLYGYQLRLQIGAVPDNHLVIADRYVPDFYADLIASKALALEDLGRRANRFPSTAVSYLVDVPDELLLSRRAPHEDAHRMTSRAQLYRALAPQLNLEVVDPMAPGCESDIAERLIGMVTS